MRCSHADAPIAGRACRHLLVANPGTAIEGFTGVGTASEWLCEACADADDRSQVMDACASCMQLARSERAGRSIGAPGVIVESTSIHPLIEHVALGCPTLVDLRPITGEDRARWIGLAADATLYEIDGTVVRTLGRAEHVDPTKPLELFVSRGARFIAVANVRGILGVVIERATWRTTLTITRDDYHAEHCGFPFTFVERDTGTLVVYAPAWNRLELADAATGTLRSTRGPMTYARGDDRPAHYLDYFHCGLAVSPGQRSIADGGWVWQPWGIVSTWSLDAWLANPYESEDGPTRQGLDGNGDAWDLPMAWLDDRRLVVWGYPGDEVGSLDAATIHDATTGTPLRWFAGVPNGDFVFDRWLFVTTETALSMWDVERGSRLCEVATAVARYHPDAKVFATVPAAGSQIVVRLAGHDATWSTGRIAELVARGEPDDLPILADLLEAAGYTDEEVLAHCRDPAPHAGRCWVFDRLAA